MNFEYASMLIGTALAGLSIVGIIVWASYQSQRGGFGK